jgi:hypothetical protein
MEICKLENLKNYDALFTQFYSTFFKYCHLAHTNVPGIFKF